MLAYIPYMDPMGTIVTIAIPPIPRCRKVGGNSGRNMTKTIIERRWMLAKSKSPVEHLMVNIPVFIGVQHVSTIPFIGGLSDFNHFASIHSVENLQHPFGAPRVVAVFAPSYCERSFPGVHSFLCAAIGQDHPNE